MELKDKLLSKHKKGKTTGTPQVLISCVYTLTPHSVAGLLLLRKTTYSNTILRIVSSKLRLSMLTTYHMEDTLTLVSTVELKLTSILILRMDKVWMALHSTTKSLTKSSNILK